MTDLEVLEEKWIVLSDKKAICISAVKSDRGINLNIRECWPDNVTQEWKPSKRGVFISAPIKVFDDFLNALSDIRPIFNM